MSRLIAGEHAARNAKRAGQTAMGSGYARVTLQTGSGVFAFASVIDNITNDPTPVTMQR